MNHQTVGLIYYTALAGVILAIGLFILPDIFTIWYANLLMRLIFVSLAGYLFTKGMVLGIANEKTKKDRDVDG